MQTDGSRDIRTEIDEEQQTNTDSAAERSEQSGSDGQQRADLDNRQQIQTAHIRQQIETTDSIRQQIQTDAGSQGHLALIHQAMLIVKEMILHYQTSGDKIVAQYSAQTSDDLKGI
ncbi:hypothetical protein Tco_0686414 [Tanacetum coccineum]